jgi:hypothetical protein
MGSHGVEAESPGYAGRRREETREKKEADVIRCCFFLLAGFLSALAAGGGNSAVLLRPLAHCDSGSHCAWSAPCPSMAPHGEFVVDSRIDSAGESV